MHSLLRTRRDKIVLTVSLNQQSLADIIKLSHFSFLIVFRFVVSITPIKLQLIQWNNNAIKSLFFHWSSRSRKREPHSRTSSGDHERHIQGKERRIRFVGYV